MQTNKQHDSKRINQQAIKSKLIYYYHLKQFKQQHVHTKQSEKKIFKVRQNLWWIGGCDAEGECGNDKWR